MNAYNCLHIAGYSRAGGGRDSVGQNALLDDADDFYSKQHN